MFGRRFESAHLHKRQKLSLFGWAFPFVETCLNPSQPHWQSLKQEGKRGLPLCTSLYRSHSCFPTRDFWQESAVPCSQRSPGQSTALSLRSSEHNREQNFLIYNQIIYSKTLGYNPRICNLCRKGFIGDTAWTMISQSSIIWACRMIL